MKDKIKYIAFDADDTLWDNEIFFQEVETKFCSLVANYLPGDEAFKQLLDKEMENLHLYGYGAKGMMLCMIELICGIADAKDSPGCIMEIIRFGKELLEKPVALLDGVEEVLSELGKEHRLVLATKGDLLDQERKIIKSGIRNYFDHIEIMSNKKSTDYLNLMNKLNCEPGNFLMVGNSLKSDIVPVLEAGASAVYIPYHITWAHEQHDETINHPNFTELNNITEIFNCL